MKRVVLAMIVMTMLCLYCVAKEKTGAVPNQFVDEYYKRFREETTAKILASKSREEYDARLHEETRARELASKSFEEENDIFLEYLVADAMADSFFETGRIPHEDGLPYDMNYVDQDIQNVFALTFRNASYGDQENLDWARKDQGEKSLTTQYGVSSVAEWYLMMKGDASDLDRVSPSLREPLAMRVAGTNLINYIKPPQLAWNCPVFVPSVTNNGLPGRY